MNEDIRISTSYPDNPKTKRLFRRLGHAGIVGHIFLLLWTGRVRPDGALTGMGAEDIAIAAGWEGDAGQFVGALEDLGLLDRDGDIYAIHDWSQWNPYAVQAPERSARARRAAQARWLGKDFVPPKNGSGEAVEQREVQMRFTVEELEALIPASQDTMLMHGFVKGAALEHGIDCVVSNLEYALTRAKTDFAAYFRKAVELDWARLHRDKMLQQARNRLERAKPKDGAAEEESRWEAAKAEFERMGEEEQAKYIEYARRNHPLVAKRSVDIQRASAVMELMIERMKERRKE